MNPMARWWLLVSTLGMVLGVGCGSEGGTSGGDTEGTGSQTDSSLSTTDVLLRQRQRTR